MNPPAEVIQWVLSALIPAGGVLFLFLLKRAFSDFEGKISQLFSKMEASLVAQQEHDTRIRLLDLRLENIERLVERLDTKLESLHASRPPQD